MGNQLLCLDATPTFLSLFDFSVAPPLLFYSYIPIIIVLLSISFLILIKDKFSLQSKVLMTVGLSFSLWVINMILQWIGVVVNFVYFSWQITAIIEIMIPISVIYLFYVLLNNGKDISFNIKLILSFIILPVIIFLPTRFNITGFDIKICSGGVGPLLYFVYFIETLSALWLVILWLARLYKSKHHNNMQEFIRIKKLVYLVVGSAIFLLVFSLSNIFGEITKVYEINLFGPIGMVIFLGILSYMIVKFKAFNIKLLATQALVWGLAILIGSQFFFIKVPVNFVLNGIGFLIAIILGQYLIRSIKKEIEAKEALKIANKRQENLIHIMNHQIKGYFTIAKNVFAELSEGETYGKMPEKVQPIVVRGLQKMNDGVDYVQGILKGESAQSGTLPMDMKLMNLKIIIEKLISEQKEIAEKKGLSFESNISDGKYNIIGDAIQLEEAFKNLFTNAIKYNSPSGSIKVTMFNKDNKILFAIKDTGRGISKEDQKNLFKPGGMGKDSMKYNTDAAGYGLAFVKPVIETHKDGKIWYDTELGKGTTFFVELPVT